MASRDAVSDLIRGNIDAIILKTLSKGDSYGYEILKSIGTASLGEYEMKGRPLSTRVSNVSKVKSSLRAFGVTRRRARVENTIG